VGFGKWVGRYKVISSMGPSIFRLAFFHTENWSQPVNASSRFVSGRGRAVESRNLSDLSVRMQAHFTAIFARDEHGLFGRQDGTMPWTCKEDMRLFVRHTKGPGNDPPHGPNLNPNHVSAMGAATGESSGATGLGANSRRKRVVIMGRRTWESLPRRPLPDRYNIVVSQSALSDAPPSKERHWTLAVAEPFLSQLRAGTKTVEGRLNTSERSEISKGDIIHFIPVLKSGSVFVGRVESVARYPGFKELLTTEGLEQVLPSIASLEEGVAVYRQFYRQDQEQEYGALAIRIEQPPKNMPLVQQRLQNGTLRVRSLDDALVLAARLLKQQLLQKSPIPAATSATVPAITSAASSATVPAIASAVSSATLGTTVAATSATIPATVPATASAATAAATPGATAASTAAIAPGFDGSAESDTSADGRSDTARAPDKCGRCSERKRAPNTCKSSDTAVTTADTSLSPSGPSVNSPVGGSTTVRPLQSSNSSEKVKAVVSKKRTLSAEEEDLLADDAMGVFVIGGSVLLNEALDHPRLERVIETVVRLPNRSTTPDVNHPDFVWFHRPIPADFVRVVRATAAAGVRLDPDDQDKDQDEDQDRDQGKDQDKETDNESRSSCKVAANPTTNPADSGKPRTKPGSDTKTEEHLTGSDANRNGGPDGRGSVASSEAAAGRGSCRSVAAPEANAKADGVGGGDGVAEMSIWVSRRAGAESRYLALVQRVLMGGTDEVDRTGVGTRSTFGEMFRCNLADGFPMLTTKAVYWKGVVEELLWFLRGETNVKSLQDRNVHIWDLNAESPHTKSLGLPPGELGPIYGRQWRAFGPPDHHGCSAHPAAAATAVVASVDQIRRLIDDIRRTPNSRRLILTAWNPMVIDRVALPSCHCFAQFEVKSGRLSCLVYIRSNDLFLGAPFNIASYALLTHIIAAITDLQVGELVYTVGNAHLYRNHIEQVKRQLSRPVRLLPNLQIDRKAVATIYPPPMPKTMPSPTPTPTAELSAPSSSPIIETPVGKGPDFSGLRFENFRLVGYDPLPAIGGDMAV
jgi:thymidylate synthase